MDMSQLNSMRAGSMNMDSRNLNKHWHIHTDIWINIIHTYIHAYNIDTHMDMHVGHMYCLVMHMCTHVRIDPYVHNTHVQ